MSNLRSALDEGASVDLSRLTGPELADRVRELDQARRRFDALWLSTLAAFHHSGEWELDGATSAGAWVAAATLQDHARAHAQVRLGRRLEHLPVVSAALADGAVSMEHARVLADAADLPEFGEAEEALVDHARSLRPAETRRVVEHWRAVVGRERGSADHDRRRLHLSSLLDGMRALDGLFDREGGVTVEKALDDLMRRTPDCPGEPARANSQRRADALVDLCDRYLRGAMGTANRKPQISLVSELETLEARAGQPARMGNGEFLSAEDVRRLACDASISRIITGPRSEPLDIGRATPVVPAGMRRALEARDGGCTYPGCDRPPDWTDSHHIVHWTRGGETKIENLTLLCRRHHRLHHTRGFRIDTEGGAERRGRPRWLRPDGTEIAPSARPPPVWREA